MMVPLSSFVSVILKFIRVLPTWLSGLSFVFVSRSCASLLLLQSQLFLDLVHQPGAKLPAPAMGGQDRLAQAAPDDDVAAPASLESAALFTKPVPELVRVHVCI